MKNKKALLFLTTIALTALGGVTASASVTGINTNNLITTNVAYTTISNNLQSGGPDKWVISQTYNIYTTIKGRTAYYTKTVWKYWDGHTETVYLEQ
ncbi:MAG: hypothetical protein LBM27_01515 [Lactobacillaceae bacterium]|jgi:hypothetical protein|nr:hypothetical protein [Lactobacillaceae bacterium]